MADTERPRTTLLAMTPKRKFIPPAPPRGVTKQEIHLGKFKIYNRIKQTQRNMLVSIKRLEALYVGLETDKFDLPTIADKFISLDINQQKLWRSSSEQVALAVPASLIRRHTKAKMRARSAEAKDEVG